MGKKKENYAIKMINVSKHFKMVFDKHHTLKELLIFRKHNQKQIHQVLKDINITIHDGESIAIIGNNGSGKSTILKLISKIIYPNQGKIITNGKITSMIELGAGFHPDFTGRENIYFNAAIFGLSKKEIDRRMDTIIAFSELEEYIDLPVRTYSSGMYMRLAFSIAINVDADILLIDEILAVGDKNYREKCFSKLLELKNSNKTIVIVSHDLEQIKQLCNRTIWIENGTIKLDNKTALVVDQYIKECDSNV